MQKKDTLPDLKSQRELDDEYARHDRFPPGWYIIPVVLLAGAAWFALIRWLMS